MKYDPTTARTCIKRFTELAHRGRSGGASSGEKVARRLAVALHAIGDDMALLDADAIEGFHMLCRLAGGPWPTDESKATAFRLIARAGAI